MKDTMQVIAEFITFSQKLLTTYAILGGTEISEEEIQTLKNALYIIKDIDKRIMKKIKSK